MRRISRRTALVGGAAALLVAGGVGVATAAALDPFDPGSRGLSGADLQRAADAAIAAAGGGLVTSTDVDDGMYELEVTLDDGTQVDVQLDRDFAVVGTRRDGPDRDPAEPAPNDPDLARASEAALAEAGGGRVTDADLDDGLYHVEVSLDDGTEVDVQLDTGFAVVGTWRDRPEREGAEPTLAAPDLPRASEAALAEVGGGRVTDAGTDDGVYEIQVTLDDGTEVDVQLDAGFTVVGTWRDGPDDD